MAKDRTPKDAGKQGTEPEVRPDLKPGTIEGELDFYDNCLKPIQGILKDAEEWKKQNG